MEKKKSNRTNLENKKGIFLQIGFIVALAVVLLAFEWRTSEKGNTSILTYHGEDVEMLLPVNTVQPKPLPPPPAPKPVVTFKEISNDAPDPLDDYRIDIDIRPDDPNPDIFILPDEPDDPLTEEPFTIVQEMPEFPGGEKAMYQFLAENIQYPEMAKQANIAGTVFVTFIIEKDGSITGITILRSPNQLLSEEATRVIASMPKWKPGKQRTRPVRVSYNIPIKFSLQ